MIHDQSSTGSTFFIEPMAIVQLNNELAELGMKEQEEIEKILASLSALQRHTLKTYSETCCCLRNWTLPLQRQNFLKKCREANHFLTRITSILKRDSHPLIPKDKVVPIDVTLRKNL